MLLTIEMLRQVVFSFETIEVSFAVGMWTDVDPVVAVGGLYVASKAINAAVRECLATPLALQSRSI